MDSLTDNDMEKTEQLPNIMLAADRCAWRETLRLGYPAIRRSARIAGRPRTELPAALKPRTRPPP